MEIKKILGKILGSGDEPPARAELNSSLVGERVSSSGETIVTPTTVRARLEANIEGGSTAKARGVMRRRGSRLPKVRLSMRNTTDKRGTVKVEISNR